MTARRSDAAIIAPVPRSAPALVVIRLDIANGITEHLAGIGPEIGQWFRLGSGRIHVNAA